MRFTRPPNRFSLLVLWHLCACLGLGPLASLLLAAGDEWPSFRHDPHLSGRSTGAGDLTSPQIRWQYDLRAHRWWMEVKPHEDNSTLSLNPEHLTPGLTQQNRVSWGLDPPLVDLSGDGVLQPTPAYAAKFSSKVPGLQQFAVRMLDAERGFCELLAADANRSSLWKSDVFPVFQNPHPVVADANADGQLDVVVCPHFQVAVLDGATGKTIQQLRWHNGRNYGHFIVKNLDADPALEMCVLGDFYSHFALIDNDGENLSLLWKKEIELKIESKSRIVRPRWDPLQDLDGDGRFELVLSLYNESGDGRWHLLVYDALTGKTLADLPDTVVEGLADLEGDGRVELFCAQATGLFVPRSSTISIANFTRGGIVERWTQPAGAWVTTPQRFPPYVNSSVADGNRNVMISTRGEVTELYVSHPATPDAGPRLQAWTLAGETLAPSWSCEGPSDARELTLLGIDEDSNSRLVEFESSLPKGSVKLKQAQGSLLAHQRTNPQVMERWGGGQVIAAQFETEGRCSLVAAAGNQEIVCLDVDDSGPSEVWRARGAMPLIAANFDGKPGKEVAMLGESASGEGEATIIMSNGQTLWRKTISGFPGPHEPWNSAALTGIAHGRFSGASHHDVLVFARRSTMHSDEGFVFGGTDGKLLWKRNVSYDGGNSWGFGGTPVVTFDQNGDGADDVHSLYPVNYTVVSGKSGGQLIGRSASGDDIMPGFWAAYSTPILFPFGREKRHELIWSGPYCVGMTDLSGDTKFAVRPSETASTVRTYPIDWDGSRQFELLIITDGQLRNLSSTTGEELWSVPQPDATQAVIADFDDDGKDEALLLCGQTVRCLSHDDGQVVEDWTVELPASGIELITADITGDGYLEVAATTTHGHLVIIDQPRQADTLSRSALTVAPQQGLTFIEEPGVRIHPEGFELPSEPDCQVWQEEDRTVYRLWWTTRKHAGQEASGVSRWTCHVSVSEDGLNFRYQRGPEFASGRFTNRTDRDLLQLADGQWRAYTLIGGGNPWYSIDSYRAGNDLAKWSWEPGVRINFGQPGEMDATAARAPEAVLLPDGSTRLYYIGWNGVQGPYQAAPSSNERWRILSAVSKDGLHFDKEPGVRIDLDPNASPPHGAVAMAKPLVVRLDDGGWRMYFAARPNGEERPYGRSVLFSAVSKDGLRWKREDGIRVVDARGKPIEAKYPSLVRARGGKLRLYYDGVGGIRSAREQ